MKGAIWGAATLLQMGLLLATVPPLLPGLGTQLWHYNAALLVAVASCAVAGRRLLDRRFLGLGVFVSTILAVGSSFYLLYDKQHLKAIGWKDYVEFWHVAWSWYALIFFLLHTYVNRAGLSRSLGRLRSGVAGKLLFDGVLVLVVVAIPFTWSPSLRHLFDEPFYIPLTLYTWLVLLVPAYGAWIVSRWRLRVGRPVAWLGRKPTQAFVDGWMLPMTLLANVSGFPILYFATKNTDFKFVAKYWHTWPSIAMAILVFAHTLQFWPAMRRHLEQRRQRLDA